MRFLLVAICASFLTGCGALPGQGPTAITITSEDIEGDAIRSQYALINVDRKAVNAIHAYRPELFSKSFRKVPGGSRSSRLGIGDRLVVTIWEAAPEGLFSTPDGKQVSVPVVVDENGYIFIPYAGRIRVAGLSVEGVRAGIQERLKGKAIEPQVLVVVEGNESSGVVVVGDVNKPGQYTMSVRGMRLLEAVARAGGSRQATYETVVTVKRGRGAGTARLVDLIEYPENNIWLVPGDNILLTHKPRTFSAFGAVKSTQLVPFKTESVTLAEGLAQVGGLKDFFADAAGIFLFRYEDRALVRKLKGPSADKFTSNRVPVVYKLNLRQAEAFFLARSLEMRDKDIIYVANHPTAEFGKFLQIIGPLLSNVNTANALITD
ncbi:polysaccharide biosynthesis/export family protein [Stappia taiwanensis]|uniref:Polysaccharide biosynthesis/export family protein n=2 Tax=Pseudomonadota TaxID=1224 RepID=A0A838XN36_9HYPH|nr:polysaccharide biosynthesis/export family protein [Stappia taiwanensis]MBA4610046.1 polysaccharide biosynthesis/export family protein [Stappia taiwanensis]GGE76517.1 sugar ABC transporter substrate-binding protein [Stappia taiwanensis]